MRVIAGANGILQTLGPGEHRSMVIALQSDPSEQFTACAMEGPQVFQMRLPIGVARQVVRQAGGVVMGVQ
jgi:hypothetical protein